METELFTTKSTLNKVQNTNKELRAKLNAVKQKIAQQKNKIDDLQDGINDLEQNSGKNSLEIASVPERVRDNKGAVLKIADAHKGQVKAEDINICHQVKRKRSNPIIVRFVSHKVKSSLYKQRVQLKRAFFRYISRCYGSRSESKPTKFSLTKT